MSYRLKFKTYPGFDIEDEELLHALHYVVLELGKHGAFRRLCNDLQSIQDSMEYWSGPPIQWLYESSYQVVGKIGWKRIATEDNVKQILDVTYSKAKFGNRKIKL